MTHPLDDRFNDLNRQGFMKFKKKKAKRAKKSRPIIACAKCQNWHEEGKHFPLREEAK